MEMFMGLLPSSRSRFGLLDSTARGRAVFQRLRIGTKGPRGSQLKRPRCRSPGLNGTDGTGSKGAEKPRHPHAAYASTARSPSLAFPPRSSTVYSSGPHMPIGDATQPLFDALGRLKAARSEEHTS